MDFSGAGIKCHPHPKGLVILRGHTDRGYYCLGVLCHYANVNLKIQIHISDLRINIFTRYIFRSRCASFQEETSLSNLQFLSLSARVCQVSKRRVGATSASQQPL